jgi:acetyltransferase-like isoleucine patch superfamily enzyme
LPTRSTWSRPATLSNRKKRRAYITMEPITIERNVWIGTAATVLPGVTIGADSVVAAGAVVTHDVPPATLAAGVPATAIRHL